MRKGIAEPRIVPDPPNWWRIALIALGILCLGAASKTVVDLLRWRDAGHAARSVASDTSESEKHRLEAMVVMSRDAHESIMLLCRIEDAGGKLGAHATNLLRTTKEALR